MKTSYNWKVNRCLMPAVVGGGGLMPRHVVDRALHPYSICCRSTARGQNDTDETREFNSKASNSRLTKAELLVKLAELEEENLRLTKALAEATGAVQEEEEERDEDHTVEYETENGLMERLKTGINWPQQPGEEFWNKPVRDEAVVLAAHLQDIILKNDQTPAGTQQEGSKLHIVHVTAEMAPLAKVGGLGDVVTGLCAASLRRGHTCEVILPFYECIDNNSIEDLKLERKFDSPSGRENNDQFEYFTVYMEAWAGKIEGCPVVLLRPDWDATGSNMFRGGAIYGGSYNETQAYLTFCRASMEYMAQSGRQPNIIHAHEWQAAAVPMLFWEMYASRMPHARPVLTIHNMDNSGECRQDEFAATGLSGSLYATVEKALDERTIGHNPERLCLLKGGIVYSSAVTTVSPTYANETLLGGSAGWLQSTLAKPEIAAKYMGVLNGIDINVWNPATDPYLAACFSSHVPGGKALCKKFLQRGLGMEEDPDKPLVAVISRLVPQKGIHLIERSVHRTVELGGQFVLLGTGHASAGLQHMATHDYAEQPNVKMLFMYSEPLSHLIYAAADMFLVPSMFEPCGLTQMIALRYGAVPIVRCTGGLADTVKDVEASAHGDASSGEDYSSMQPQHADGNGFVFHGVDVASVDSALDRAIAMYQSNPEAWTALVNKNMRDSSKWSWDAPAASYEQLYTGALRG